MSFTSLLYAQISGEVRIGENQNSPFNTIESALDLLKKEGISGLVSFILEDDNYTTKPLIISDIPGLDRGGVLEFKPAIHAKPVIKLNGKGVIFRITTPGRVIIDGRHFINDTTQNITLQAGGGIYAWSQETNLASKQMHLTVRNCLFISNTGHGSAFVNNDIRSETISIQDSIQLIENRIIGYDYGLVISGPTLISLKNIISDCFYAIFVDLNDVLYIGDIILQSNVLINNVYGITCQSATNKFIIQNNRIIGGVNSIVGFNLESFTNLKIYNNLIHGDLIYGIILRSNSNFKPILSVCYNTISISSTRNSMRSIYHESSLKSNSCILLDLSNIEMQFANNILESNHKIFSLSDPFYLIIDYRTEVKWAPSGFVEFGNCFFNNQTDDYWGLGSRNKNKTYKDWSKNTNQAKPSSSDKKSSFVSETDFHLTIPNHQGIPLPEITTDIDGKPRDPLNPDAGAYEFVQISVSPVIRQVGQCQASEINFSVGSLPYNSTVISWSFGDGQISNTLAPSHTYAATGIYTVVLTFVNATGQQQTISKDISVYALPTKPVVKIRSN